MGESESNQNEHLSAASSENNSSGFTEDENKRKLKVYKETANRRASMFDLAGICIIGLIVIIAILGLNAFINPAIIVRGTNEKNMNLDSIKQTINRIDTVGSDTVIHARKNK